MNSPASLTLSADEAGAELGVSGWSIREGVRRGKIPNAGVGRRVRIPRAWVEERLAGGMASGSGDDRLAALENQVALLHRALGKMGAALCCELDEAG